VENNKKFDNINNSSKARRRGWEQTARKNLEQDAKNLSRKYIRRRLWFNFLIDRDEYYK
jgi:hypothetical protein